MNRPHPLDKASEWCHGAPMNGFWQALLRRSVLTVAFACGALGLSGCPERKSMSTPKPCTEAYAQCQRPEGPIGVCQEVTCAGVAGKMAPCFTCVSQH